MELILVRHGETQWNHERRIQGSTDIPLNDAGRAQAADLAARLLEEFAGAVSAVVSSDLLRARETATIIANTLGAGDPAVYTDLRERNYGDAEGTHIDDFHTRWGDWLSAEVPRAESWTEVRERGLRGIRAATDDVRAASPDAEVLIAVSHGAFIRELIRHASNGELPAPGERLANASLHRFRLDEERLHLLSYSGVPL